jgi:hypothetical protein
MAATRWPSSVIREGAEAEFGEREELPVALANEHFLAPAVAFGTATTDLGAVR